jgi:hypothetical protein
MLNVAKEYYDKVFIVVMRFKMFAFQNKRKDCCQDVALKFPFPLSSDRQRPIRSKMHKTEAGNNLMALFKPDKFIDVKHKWFI